MKTIAVTLAAFAMLSLSVRAKDKADKLVGKWEATKGPGAVGSTLEFTKDGKVYFQNKDKTENQEGTYKLDGDTLKYKITDKRAGEERTESVKIKRLTDKELVIGHPKVGVIEYKKVK